MVGAGREVDQLEAGAGVLGGGHHHLQPHEDEGDRGEAGARDSSSDQAEAASILRLPTQCTVRWGRDLSSGAALSAASTVRGEERRAEVWRPRGVASSSPAPSAVTASSMVAGGRGSLVLASWWGRGGSVQVLVWVP